ncbi:MAG: hypothetical protein RL189_1160 [Pseudomonadota bacterium]|jgi:uncharacterized protein YfkK (UPF0435 family)
MNFLGITFITAFTLMTACKPRDFNASSVNSNPTAPSKIGCFQELLFRDNILIKQLKSIEIPSEFVDVNFSASTPPELKNMLLFKRGGTEFVRWIFNAQNSEEFEEQLRDVSHDLGFRPNVSYDFEGTFKTNGDVAWIFDPASGRAFYQKWYTPESFYGEKIEHGGKQITDYMEPLEKKFQLKWANILKFPATMSFKKGGWKGKAFQVGGDSCTISHFSVKNQLSEKEFLKLGVQGNRLSYWKEHFLRPLALAGGEVAGMFGLFSLKESGKAVNFDVTTGKIDGKVTWSSDLEGFGLMRPWLKINFSGSAVKKSLNARFEKLNILNANDVINAQDFARAHQDELNDYYNDIFFQEFNSITGMQVTRENVQKMPEQEYEKAVNRINTCVNTGKPPQGEVCPQGLMQRIRR